MAWWSRCSNGAPAVAASELTSWSDMGIGGADRSGVTVTPTMALNVPAVYACVLGARQDVARMPIKLRRKIGRGQLRRCRRA